MEKEPMPLRILVLETSDYWVARAALQEDTIIFGEVKCHNRGYTVPDETRLLTRRLTQAHEVDLVILGNNQPAGVVLAECIDESMCSRTIIVWNEYLPGKEAGYKPKELGFRFFCSWGDLPAYLQQVREQLEAEAG